MDRQTDRETQRNRGREKMVLCLKILLLNLIFLIVFDLSTFGKVSRKQKHMGV